MPSEDKSHKKRQTTIAITVSLVLGSLLLACISCCIWRKKKRRRRGTPNDHHKIYYMLQSGSYVISLIYSKYGVTAENRNDESFFEDEDIELPIFDLDTVIAATDNFSTENKLGEGGFGPVYWVSYIFRVSRCSIRYLTSSSNRIPNGNYNLF